MHLSGSSVSTPYPLSIRLPLLCLSSPFLALWRSPGNYQLEVKVNCFKFDSEFQCKVTGDP